MFIYYIRVYKTIIIRSKKIIIKIKSFNNHKSESDTQNIYVNILISYTYYYDYYTGGGIAVEEKVPGRVLSYQLYTTANNMR